MKSIQNLQDDDLLLTSKRLKLEIMNDADATDLFQLIKNPNIAETALNIPCPYKEQMAFDFISYAKLNLTQGKGIHWAIKLGSDGTFIGSIGLTLNQRHSSARLGYWIGESFWGNGFCTEALSSVLRFGFTKLNLNKIIAEHFSRNPASGKVMQKNGMLHEGTLRSHYFKGGKYEDVESYGILAEDFNLEKS